MPDVIAGRVRRATAWPPRRVGPAGGSGKSSVQVPDGDSFGNAVDTSYVGLHAETRSGECSGEASEATNHSVGEVSWRIKVAITRENLHFSTRVGQVLPNSHEAGMGASSPRRHRCRGRGAVSHLFDHVKTAKEGYSYYFRIVSAIVASVAVCP